jgi:hypothetical protein
MNLNSVLARMSLIVLLFMTPSGPAALADNLAVPEEPLTLQIEYWSVGELGETDKDGWLLAWKAEATGDLNGEMRWWFTETPPAPESEYSHGEVGYYVARWEFWQGDELILTGKSAGKTIIPDGEDGIWDGHGTVMKANGNLSSRTGHRIYETGIVIMPSDPEVTSSGSGMFVIY